MKLEILNFTEEVPEPLTIIDNTSTINEVIMAHACHICGETSYDNCVSCKRPTCKKHGKLVGDHFVCKTCSDKFR